MQEDFSKIENIKDIKSVLVNFIPFFYRKKNYLKIFSMCAYRIPAENKNTVFEKKIKLNDDYYPANFLLKKGIKFLKYCNYNYYFNIYSGKIAINQLASYSPQNLFTIAFKNKDQEILMPVVYNIIYLTKYLGKTSKVYPIDENLVCFFRQANKNSISITVRKPNVTDHYSKRLLILGARILSLLMPKSNKVIFYEKESNAYEHSAAHVYEKLIDQGYQNCYFVINQNSPHVKFIAHKYQKNIIWAHSFKHYLNFFRCKTFISSESIPHCIELRAANTHITKKIANRKFRYVFLQHGVMYMVSLSSKGRNFFIKNKEMPSDAKIVVSSKLEADHFVELGGFEYEDLYITGLPQYDRIVQNKNADKIVIMPTWRPWEYNILQSDYKNAGYYQMIQNIIKNIPKGLHDKIMIVPHPLITDKLRKTDLKPLIPKIIAYDKIMADAALLITDYSSIAYLAFYGGSNIIFCFEQLKECMEKYGGHLMLNEKNAFGDISYKYSDLKKLVANNYLKPQSTLNIKRYKKIVEFDDNKNTERLIEMLKKDKFI